MSTRQQQQMEAQQQVLVAKEQRLKYLRQHESMQAQRLAHTDQLRRAADRVESQEMKLRKLRALRGQAEQYKQNNGQLSEFLTHTWQSWYPKLVRLDPKGTFKDQFSVHFGAMRQNELKSDL